MRARLKAAVVNSLVLLVATGVGYLILGLVFFRVALPMLPLNVRTHLPELPDALVQNTKRHYVPLDYIALLGDSYADGAGDWLLESNGNRAKPFHSANIIHDLTGRDVVSFGRPGGSAEGLVLRPARVFAISDCFLFPKIEHPAQIVYYFFEGNDLEDNLELLRKVDARYGKTDAPAIKRYLIEEFASASSWRCHLHLGDTMARMARFAYQFYVQKKNLVYNNSSNTVTIAGKDYGAAPLLGPGLDLAPGEMETALTVFDPSLAWLRNRFPNSPVSVVYIPSPLHVYAHLIRHPMETRRASRSTVLAYRGGATPAFKLADRASDRACEHVRALSILHGARFIDARPALRKAAATRPIHGPIDWGHLNEQGYRVLGALVAGQIKQPGPDADCKVAE